MNKRLFGVSSLAMLASACAPSFYRLSNVPVETPVERGRTPDMRRETTARHDVVMQAMAMLDRNYTYGGKKLHTGFDCSGLVSFVFKESAALSLTGSAADLAKRGRAIRETEASPGDLVFFNTLGAPHSHVGIYIGADKFIHAANERTGVRAERLSNSYWAQRLEGYRSVLD